MIGDKPAFPATIKNQHPVSHMPGSEEKTPGMTLRQWYAGMAMQGIRANPVTMQEALDEAGHRPGECIEVIVRMMAEAQADAMLEEGDNEKKEG